MGVEGAEGVQKLQEEVASLAKQMLAGGDDSLLAEEYSGQFMSRLELIEAMEVLGSVTGFLFMISSKGSVPEASEGRPLPTVSEGVFEKQAAVEGFPVKYCSLSKMSAVDTLLFLPSSLCLMPLTRSWLLRSSSFTSPLTGLRGVEKLTCLGATSSISINTLDLWAAESPNLSSLYFSSLYLSSLNLSMVSVESRGALPEGNISLAMALARFLVMRTSRGLCRKNSFCFILSESSIDAA